MLEENLPDLSRVEQLFAIGGVAGASLAGAGELRKDNSIRRTCADGG